MAGSDDLAPLLVPHHSADSGPTPALSSEEPARYGQGTILTWDPDTFENAVRFRGTTLVNLPVMAGTDALTFRPGDKVGIMFWAPAGGSGVFWILPRIIVPGSGAAEQAISALTTDLGRAVALAAIGEAVQVIQPEAGALYCGTYDTWAGPVNAAGDPAPFEASGIQAGLTGQCVVLLSASVLVMTDSGQSGAIWLSFEAERESTSDIDVSPGIGRALSLGRGASAAGETVEWPRGTPSRAVVVQLQQNETYTLRAKLMQNVNSGNPRAAGELADASMVVIPT